MYRDGVRQGNSGCSILSNKDGASQQCAPLESDISTAQLAEPQHDVQLVTERGCGVHACFSFMSPYV